MTNPTTYLSNPEHRAAAVKRLALSFADTLRDEIGEEDFQEVRARNATEEYARFCASHDFCDANMTMFDSFNTEIGWDCDLDNDEDTSVWNEAWALARVTYLTAALVAEAV
jgi:hypothetical protein